MTAPAWFAGVPYRQDTAAGATPGMLVRTATPVQPATGATVPAPAAGVPVLAVIGDSYSSPDWAPAGPASGWPVLVAVGLGLSLVNLAAGGSGYVHASASTFPSAAARVPAGADVVVVFGGINDQGEAQHVPANVPAAARATFGTVRRLAPAARLIVVGPQWPYTGPPPATHLTMRDGIAAAALQHGATWLDPIADGWLADRALIAADGHHPNVAGHRMLAERIGGQIGAVLGRAGGAVMLSPGNRHGE